MESRLDGGTALATARWPRPAVGVPLGENAVRILEKRYLLKDDEDQTITAATPAQYAWPSGRRRRVSA